MSNRSFNENEVRCYLAAFADGELDIEQTLRALEHMAMNPQATQRVMHQQQLRQAVDRVVRANTPQTPAELVAKVSRLAEAEAQAPARQESRNDAPAGRSASILRRLGPLSLAAVLMMAAALFWASTSGPGTSVSGHDFLPVQQVRLFAKRHVSCTRMLEALMHIERFPQDVQTLPVAVGDFLGERLSAGMSLDLNGLGYQFAGAGECMVPGKDSVHLIYHALPGSDRNDTLSLWMKADHGKLDIAPGKIHAANGPDAAHPILVWRDGGVIYYLVGDSAQHTEAVAAYLRQSI